MPSVPDDGPKSVTLVCGTCHARFDPKLKGLAYFAKCPDCYKRVRVPSRDEVIKHLAEQKQNQPPQEEVSAYRLATQEQPVADESPKSITIVCKKCHARLDPVLKAEPRKVRCPDCHEPVEVPSLSEVQTAETKKPKRRRERDPVPLPVPAPPKRPRLQTSYLEVQSEIYVEKVDPPPEWTFFSGVFTFPWSSGARMRWVFMSLGWGSVALLGIMLLLIYSNMGVQSGMALAFFALPAIWITFWTLSYAAACFLPVVIDTAAGNDEVNSWPDPVFKEWAVQLIYLSFISLEANVAAYGIGQLIGMATGDPVTPALFASFALFPIILLSSLEANTAFIPLTLPVLRTLATHAWAWIVFYALTGAMMFFWVWLFPYAVLWNAWLAFLAAGPVWAASVLIYARLLGRLGWQTSISNEPVEVPEDARSLSPEYSKSSSVLNIG